jgi:hypothetical protein
MQIKKLAERTGLLNTPFASSKHRHLRQNPRISVCVEDGYRYLTLRGRVELNENPQEAGDKYQSLGQRYRHTFRARDGGERPAILYR